MTRTQRTALAVFLALGFMASMSAWMPSGPSNAQAEPAPLTRMEYLAKIGCDANAFPTATWIGVVNGRPQVGMGAEALVCTLGAPDSVRTITTSHGETAFQTYHRDGQRPLLVQVHNSVVTAIAD
jgi:hypothetical protein